MANGEHLFQMLVILTLFLWSACSSTDDAVIQVDVS